MDCPRCQQRYGNQQTISSLSVLILLYCNAPPGFCAVPTTCGPHRHAICYVCYEGFPVTPEGKEII